MRKFFAAAAAVLAVGSMAACSANEPAARVVSQTTTSTAPVTSGSENATTPRAEVADALVTGPGVPRNVVESVAPASGVQGEVEVVDRNESPQASTEPTFVACQMADGTAVMSDGSTTYKAKCDVYAGGPPRLAGGRSIGVQVPTETPPAGDPDDSCESSAHACQESEC